MNMQKFDRVDWPSIEGQLSDLYSVCNEIKAIVGMLDELTGGGRNLNDVYAIEACTEKLRKLRTERAAIRRIIHEMPILAVGIHPSVKTLGPEAAE